MGATSVVVGEDSVGEAHGRLLGGKVALVTGAIGSVFAERMPVPYGTV